MTTTSPSRTHRSFDLKLAKAAFARSRAYDVRVQGQVLTAEGAPEPHRVTLLGSPDDPTHLFVDQYPVDRADWEISEQGKVLHWTSSQDGIRLEGHVVFQPHALVGHGSMLMGESSYSVELTLAPASYTCNVTPGPAAGAYYDTSKHSLVWNASSDTWQKATWIPQALRFTYAIHEHTSIGVSTYTIDASFSDLRTGKHWHPGEDETSILVDPDLLFVFGANDGVTPPDESAPAPVTSVFPYQMNFQFSGDASTFAGALLTGSESALGTVVAVAGVTDNPAIVGSYEVTGSDGTTSHVTVRGGQLVVDGNPVPGSQVEGDVLTWSEGRIEFSPDGADVVSGTGISGGRRLTAAELQPAHVAALTASTATSPSATTLLNMTQFSKDKDEHWIDIVQSDSLSDFYDSIKFMMDQTLRTEYLDANPVDIDPNVEVIAQMHGADGSDPKTFYDSLSVAYLTNALRQVSSDPASGFLNDRRAQAWMTSTVSSAPVYQVQGPALYSRRFTMQPQNSTLPQFLEDQVANQATYATFIGKDQQQWKAQAAAMLPHNPDRLKSFTEMIDTVAQAGSQGKYWAYWFFRNATQPSALHLMQLMSLNAGNLDGSAYTRTVQSNCAVLTMLDTSGLFAKQYIQAIRLFQLANMLPQLLDYTGDIDDYSFAVEQIIQAFIQENASSDDPDIRDAVAKFQKALDEHWISEILAGFAGIASAFDGMYSWEQVAQKFAKDWPNISKIPIGVAKLISMAAVGVGMLSFAYGIKNWKQLDGDARASVVAGGIEVLTQMVVAVVKRGVAWYKVLSTDGLSWGSLWDIMKGDVLEMAESRMSAGATRWLIRQGEFDMSEPELFGNLFFTEGEEDERLMVKLFGNNLDDFVATRLGACFAIIGIVTSAIAIAEGGDEMEMAENGLFLAASCLDFLAAAGGWALGAAGIAEIGGLAVATIASCLTILGAFAAIAGAILLIYLMFTTHPKSAIQIFAEGPAKDAGFYMALKTDIDYFQVPLQVGQEQMVGVALLTPDGTAVRMDPAGPVTLSTITNSGDTCFYLKTDAEGRASILAQLPAKSGGLLASYLLTAKPGEVLTAPVDSKGDGQRWTTTIQTADLDANGAPLSGTFTVSATLSDGSTHYLVENGGIVGLGTTPYTWTLKRVTMAPGSLLMQDITVYADLTNSGQWAGYLGQHGSNPLTWSVAPPLPSFLKLDTATGFITWAKPGTTVSDLSDQQYTLAVTNPVASQPVSATFHIKVVKSPAPAKALAQ
jgi:hypothetical protein